MYASSRLLMGYIASIKMEIAHLIVVYFYTSFETRIDISNVSGTAVLAVFRVELVWVAVVFFVPAVHESLVLHIPESYI